MSYTTTQAVQCGSTAGKPSIQPMSGRTATAVFTAAAATSGVYEAIAGVAGRRIRVLSAILTSNTAGTVSLRDATTPIRSVYLTANAVGTNYGIVQPGHLLAAGAALNLHHSGGTTETFTGSIDYCLES